MTKFNITVQETVVVTYQTVEVEAENQRDAEKIAEELRVQGELGEPTQAVRGC